MKYERHRRVVCWFSCGATSAIASKLALEVFKGNEVELVYCDTGSEHPDNYRFLRDIESWLDCKVIVLKSSKYNDIWDVFNKTNYLVGAKGARCTIELKKVLRHSYQRPDDIHVFGFDIGERSRLDRFIKVNMDITIEAPLIEEGLSKKACLRILKDAGIEIPMMYKLGFPNSNCIGCVKGGMKYWNHVRKVFPETFDRMAKLERKLNISICKRFRKKGKRPRVFLDELDPDEGRGSLMKIDDCNVLCSIDN